MGFPEMQFLCTWNEIMNKNVLEIINTESSGKTYIDPQTAEVIIGMIDDLKKKVANAEELLESMECEPE